MNHITVLFFATLRDRVGTKSLELDIPAEMTVQELMNKLSMDIPSLKQSMQSVVVTVNREYALGDAFVPAGAEIGLFPPVSGG